jgi:hypothetical protein
MGCNMWLRRVGRFKERMAERNVTLEKHVLLRAYISCAIDSDDTFYALVSFVAASFLFLGGFQLHFKWTLLAMILTYTVTSVGETASVILAVRNTPSSKELIVTSDTMGSRMRNLKAELNPTSVYEDLGRDKTIVLMVFITQVILIVFVVRSLCEWSKIRDTPFLSQYH